MYYTVKTSINGTHCLTHSCQMSKHDKYNRMMLSKAAEITLIAGGTVNAVNHLLT